MPVGQTKCPSCKHYLETQHERAWREVSSPIKVPRPEMRTGYRCRRCSCTYFPRPKKEDDFIV